MMELPYDRSRCPGGECHKKNQCARYTSSSLDGFLKSFTDFHLVFYKDGKCDYFIDNEKKYEQETD